MGSRRSLHWRHHYRKAVEYFFMMNNGSNRDISFPIYKQVRVLACPQHYQRIRRVRNCTTQPPPSPHCLLLQVGRRAATARITRCITLGCPVRLAYPVPLASYNSKNGVPYIYIWLGTSLTEMANGTQIPKRVTFEENQNQLFCWFAN